MHPKFLHREVPQIQSYADCISNKKFVCWKPWGAFGFLEYPGLELSGFLAQLDGRVVSVGPIVRAPGCARIGVAAKRNGACFV